MPTVRLYDPYRIIDPTDKNAVSIRIASRTARGRFNGNAVEYGENSYPIESHYWAMAARWEWQELGRLMGSAFLGTPDMILPPPVTDNFSWRMICEMVGAACKVAKVYRYDKAAVVSAAHKYLADVQYETARAHLDDLMGAEAPKELDAVTMSQTISDWLHESWDLIPEVTY